MYEHIIPERVSIEQPATKISEYGHLISPARDRNRPIYNWHSFKHSYSKDLVEKLAHKFGLTKNSWVLDPFCGGGTTLLACKELGINSIGFDILPFSVFLSNVKTRTHEPTLLRKHLEAFRGSASSRSRQRPDIPIIRKAFAPEIWDELLGLKSKIDAIADSSVRDFYLLGLLSILESVSNTSKTGGFLRIEKKRVPVGTARHRFLSRIEEMIRDVEQFNKALKFQTVRAGAAMSDARLLKTERKFDAIITSPPYPNRHDYTRIYSLELIVGFIRNNAELKALRYNTLRSHVEARRRFTATSYQQPRIVKALVTRIRNAGLNNPQVPEMISGYFEDMYLALLQMRKCLKKDGKLALVVSNVRFGGVSVPVDKILAEIGTQAGLTNTAILVARRRSNSAQQMKSFKRVPSRESIVIWERRLARSR